MNKYPKIDLVLAYCGNDEESADSQVLLLSALCQPYPIPNFRSAYSQEFDFSLVANFCQKLEQITNLNGNLPLPSRFSARSVWSLRVARNSPFPASQVNSAFSIFNFFLIERFS